MKTILVTGSDGFIGRQLIKKLKEDTNNLVIECDISDNTKSLSDFYYQKYDIIYHLGAISDTRETNKELIYERNVKAVQNLIDYNRSFNKDVFISFASSASVYGKTNKPSFVSDALNPESLYAKSKMCGEILLELSGLEYNCLRFFNVYSTDGISERNKESHASPYYKFLNQDQITIFEGSDTIRRDFIHVDDVVNLIINKTYVSGTFNVGTGKTKTFLDVAEYCRSITGKEIVTVEFPSDLKQTYQYYTCAGF